MTYTRIRAEGEGESHFAQVEADFAAVDDYAPGMPTLGIARLGSADAIEFIHVPAGFESDRHAIPQRQFIVVLAGRWRCW